MIPTSVFSTMLDENPTTRSPFAEIDIETAPPFFSARHKYAKLKDIHSEDPIELKNMMWSSKSIQNYKPLPPLPKNSSGRIFYRAEIFWKSLAPGWRKGLAWNSSFTAIVLLLNMLWLVVTVAKFPSEQGIYSLYEGNCFRASTMDSALHVIINILSTALLGSSNYAAQCLTSPTRAEVDRAHRTKRWLYIGVPNVKNLLWISWFRKPLVILLVISAWPLHLLWNSVVFKTLQANQYAVLVVSTDFISSEIFDDSLINIDASTGFLDYTVPLNGPDPLALKFPTNFTSATFLEFSKSLYYKTKIPGSMEFLNNADCMKQYSQQFLTNRRNLLLVSNTTTHPLPSGQSQTEGTMLAYMDSRSWQASLVAQAKFWNPGAFICSGAEFNAFTHHGGASCGVGEVDSCDLEESLTYASNWTIVPYFSGGGVFASWVSNNTDLSGTYVIDYCLSELVPEACQVQLVLPIMCIVIGCNIVKLICVISTIFSFRKPPLVVIGDALSSFLGRKDPATIGERLRTASHHYLRKSKNKFWSPKGRIRRWKHVTRSDLWLAIIFCFATLMLACYLLTIGISSLDGQTFGGLSFGAVSPSSLITYFAVDTSIDASSSSLSVLIQMISIANSPQILFSLLYLLYNRTYTKMLAMHEWTKFAIERRGLRVSQPTGVQRSTYWLHLPYRYSIPLLFASSLMHWIISQCLFLVRVDFYDLNGQPAYDSQVPFISSCDQTSYINSYLLPAKSGSNTVTLPGYSPKAILAAIILGSTMVLTLIVLSFRRFPSAMPLVGNSSWAISAACHRPDDDKEAALKAVKWGLVSLPGGDRGSQYCLTSFDVKIPFRDKKHRLPRSKALKRIGYLGWWKNNLDVQK